MFLQIRKAGQKESGIPKSFSSEGLTLVALDRNQ